MASIKAYYGRTYRGSKNRFLDFLQKRIDEKKGCFVVTANPEIFMLGKKMPEMNRVLMDKNTVIAADGIGIVKGGEQLGFRFKERIPGVELCEELLKYANEKSARFICSEQKERFWILLSDGLRKSTRMSLFPDIQMDM
ncbi:MAG: WecB/TagA/CpsF family glycosyltransferase [[Ruminococcus] torques]